MSRPIEDYALIGDCETAALVANDGSIDWLCWPRFDSPACLAALLGDERHGRWRIAPRDARARSRRRYLGDTLVLETEFETAEGSVAIIDFMSIRNARPVSELVRLVVGRRGRVGMRMDLALRFDYGRIVPWVTRADDGLLRAEAGPCSATLSSPVSTHADDHATVAEFDVEAGQRLPFVLVHKASHLPPPDIPDVERALRDTCGFWTGWSARSDYTGPWQDAVRRSLITVKALTYHPTGGIVAAPTTSLPERIGGPRNWDYRYCWLRDATFTLLSLINAGHREEAEAWCGWLMRSVAGVAAQTQPLYAIDGGHRTDEVELDHLPGYAGSRPVRIGNGAYGQLQLDVFGSIVDTFHEASANGLTLPAGAHDFLRDLLAHLETAWRQEDEGIWEVRGGRRHFVHSRLMCWVAFDRAVRLAHEFGLDGPVERWARARDAIHAEVLERGYDEARGAFVQAYGSSDLDAAVLLMPILGFLPANDPRMLSTTRVIERELMRDGLLLRYDPEAASDGVDGEEGAFLACSFWLADNMILQGRDDDARELYDRLLSLRNDVGLLAEQYDTRNRRLLGNFPQAFSHFALIDTAFNFAGRRGAAREARQA
ncbi:glucoamylase [Lysobacteraceae bacterium NML91-0213]|nr:glucoamylase [Xanthomonadaceae bacterium NML91-0213]